MKSRLVFPIALFLPAVFLFSGCRQGSNPKPPEQVAQVQRTPAPLFNSDSAYAFVKAQCDFGPRVPNTLAHDACAKYLAGKISQYTPHVLVQRGQVVTFNRVTLQIQNVIGQFQPESKKRVLLFAHWDTRPWADQDSTRSGEPILGADDGASGVAVLLEIARVLSKQAAPVGVDIAFFDAEDYGTRKSDPPSEDSYALGTQYWCKNLEPAGYTADYGILLDMVGARNASFYQEGRSLEYAATVVKKIWSAAARSGATYYFKYMEGGYVDDDHLYPNRMLNLPCADIINLNPEGNNYGFADHWHRHSDNMEIIDRGTLRAVGQTVLEVIFGEGPDN